MRARTTDDLLTDVRARVAAPSADGRLSESELLSLCDQELEGEIGPLLISARSEYWLRTQDQPIVAGKASYALPDRALAMGLRDVLIVDSAGVERNAIQVPATERHLSRQASRGPAPFDFTLENGKLVLLPTPASSGYTLRLRYYATPSRLTQTANAAYVLQVSSADSVATSSTGFPPVMEPDSPIDIIRGAGMHDAIATNLTASVWAAGIVSLDTSLTPDEMGEIYESDGLPGERRDYVCLAGTTVYPPIPASLWPVFVSACARSYCEAVGDLRGFEAANSMLDQRKSNALTVLIPRVDGEPRRVIPRGTPLRGGRKGWWR